MSQTERLNSVKANDESESGLGVLPPLEECTRFSSHGPHLMYLKGFYFMPQRDEALLLICRSWCEI